MENQYKCPICFGQLKVCDFIVFAAKNSKKERGLILLHPEIGNYSSLKHPDFSFETGEAIEFFCPICHKSLASDIDPNLTLVLLTEPDGKEYQVYFSRIAGEKSTYKVDNEEVTSAGEHADRYTHFRIADKYKKYLH